MSSNQMRHYGGCSHVIFLALHRSINTTQDRFFHGVQAPGHRSSILHRRIDFISNSCSGFIVVPCEKSGSTSTLSSRVHPPIRSFLVRSHRKSTKGRKRRRSDRICQVADCKVPNHRR
jgi:hypothetical protein